MALYEVRYVGTYQGQVWNNVMHFVDNDGIDSPVDYDTIGASLTHNTMLVAFRNVQVASSVTRELQIKAIHPVPTDPLIYTFPSGVGQIASSGMPSYVSTIISIRTGFASRRKRGRIYLPGVPEAYCDNGNMEAAGVTGYTTLINTLVGRYGALAGTEPITLGVWSRTQAGSMPYDTSAWTPAQTLALNTIFGTQRRRRVGHGV